jgi:hypothetical protein
LLSRTGFDGALIDRSSRSVYRDSLPGLPCAQDQVQRSRACLQSCAWQASDVSGCSARSVTAR